MESAAVLAMETSKVKSGVRNQAEAKLNQLEHSTSAVIECRSDHQRCTIYLAERPSEGPAGKSARAEELLQREERLALGAHLGRGRICMLEQTKNQLVKDKPAGQNLQEQIMIEDLSSEDDEGQLERRSAEKSKLEELLKSDCKR
ncbi:hypothetical protein F511_31776 [Dorcoceras hygrometricum]|uniref:Uncharacterized protein n=1 Tax=Dorcoceras hygrometricum TaxID=472368 RepID=A0A2Z7BL93_9LAMI|nr:hypothetical protein F511_31776 [Dorcoceras hygrometricum]